MYAEAVTESTELQRRMEERIRAWGVHVERIATSESAAVAFGRREGQPVVLKVIRTRSDEWRAGEIVRAFDGRGVVRVLDHVAGALLLERLDPGEALTSVVDVGDDDRATGILAGVIRRLAPRSPPRGVPTVATWGAALDRYDAGGDDTVPRQLLDAARRVHAALCRSQTRVRLLHGDLHHDNVLFDARRGWLAIDPKGVIGEPEYEIGAALRNPHDRPELFLDAATIERRVSRFARELKLDRDRILAWAFAQAVLSAVWTVEDGGTADAARPALALAAALWPMLARSSPARSQTRRPSGERGTGARGDIA